MEVNSIVTHFLYQFLFLKYFAVMLEDYVLFEQISMGFLILPILNYSNSAPCRTRKVSALWVHRICIPKSINKQSFFCIFYHLIFCLYPFPIILRLCGKGNGMWFCASPWVLPFW